MWRTKTALGMAAITLACVGWGASPAGAAPESSADVVARVGPLAITEREFARRLGTLSSDGVEALGGTPQEVKRNLLERVLVPEALFALAAAAGRVGDRSLAQARIQNLLRAASLRGVQADARREGVTQDDWARYYRDNDERFHTPERLYVWRILCATREDAIDLLDELKKDHSAKKWAELARAHSIDERTRPIGGNMGLIMPDGSAAEEHPSVAPALYAAASAVKDGEIVGEPVAEGHAFAVVWRRGSEPAIDRTPQKKEEGALEQVLLRVKVEQAVKSMVQGLREATRIEQNAQFLDLIEVDSSGNVVARRRPGSVSQRSAGYRSTPRAPRGGF